MEFRGLVIPFRRTPVFRRVSPRMPQRASLPNLAGPFEPNVEKESPVPSPRNHIPPVEVQERAACMCDDGDACSSFAPGHALHLIQARLAAATPSDWSDAIVEASDPH